MGQTGGDHDEISRPKAYVASQNCLIEISETTDFHRFYTMRGSKLPILDGRDLIIFDHGKKITY